MKNNEKKRPAGGNSRTRRAGQRDVDQSHAIPLHDTTSKNQLSNHDISILDELDAEILEVIQEQDRRLRNSVNACEIWKGGE